MFVIRMLDRRILIFLLFIFPIILPPESWGATPAEVNCLQCHRDLEKKFASGIVHQAIRQDNCTGCHNPHTASFPHLLVRTGASLCYHCHEERKKKWQEMKMHAPLQQEGCLGCHDAHVSLYRFLVKADGQALCFRCHPAEDFRKKYVHQPVKEGKCRACHDSHASKENFLLVASPKKICLICHGQKNLTELHQGVDVRGSECTLCHSPHASGSRGLLYDFSHKPYQERQCRQCHKNEKEMQRTFVAQGANLCYTCHQKEKERFQGASRSHMASGDDECVYCHTPHVSLRKDLTRRDVRTLCLSCHPGMAVRLKEDAESFRHPEVVKGNCTSCHDPHSSSQAKFFKANSLELCTKCHARQKKASHPTGEKAIDPRDRKSPIMCDTCHDPMGTKFKYSLRLDGSEALCKQCHKR
ncbi:MAG: cytochrome c3 family protein [bacterium]